MTRWRLLTLLAAALSGAMILACPSHGEPLESARAATPLHVELAEELLKRIIAIRYAYDSRAHVDLRVRDASGGERHRRIQMVSKHRDGRPHSIGRLVAPEYLRGMTILSIETPNRTDDVFVYLPSLGRVRRVSIGRRVDSFLGSDLTYADFDRHRAEDYAIESLTEEELSGEPVHVITARPRVPEAFRRLAFVAAQSDLALLELRYAKDGETRPSRVVRFPRASIRAFQGHLIPTRVLVVDAVRGSETELVVSDLEINPEIDDRLFSLATLESGRALGVSKGARERTRRDTH